MRDLDYQEHIALCEDLKNLFGGKYDGSKKNILVPECPFCGKTGDKFGIYIGKPTGYRVPFMWNCFSCGKKGRDLKYLLENVGRVDLYPTEVTSLEKKIIIDDSFKLNVTMNDHQDDDDDDLFYCEMPYGYKRTFFNTTLKNRGFTFDDYEFFEVGLVPQANPKFYNYLIFPIKEDNTNVGYVARHIMGKSDLEELNKNQKFLTPRYRNSTEEEANDFQHLMYNIDSVIEGETKTVILVEGVFDAIALVRKLDLYDREDIAVCATFGKQINPTKMEKLQKRGVEKVILGYDGDAVNYTMEASNLLDEYFDILVADIEDPNKDWDDLDASEIISIFANNLLTPVEYHYKKIKL